MLTTPQLMGILATQIGGKLRIVGLYESSVRPAYAMDTLSTGCQTKMGVVYDEHLVFLLHLKQYQRTRSSPTAHACHRSSGGNGLAVDKRVSHGSLPIFAHYVTRWSPRL